MIGRVLALTLSVIIAASGCASQSIPDGNRYEFAFATAEDCEVVAALRAALPAPGRSQTITQLINRLEPAFGPRWPFSTAMGPPSAQDRVGPLNLSNCAWGAEGILPVGPPPVGYLTPVYSQDRTLALTGISQTPDKWPTDWKVALLVREPQGWRVLQWADYRTTVTDPRDVQ